MTTIYLEHTIDAGHRIVGHKGKCARLHGHTYRFEVEVGGTLTEPGFIADFGDIKGILNEWDHRMLLWDEDPIWQEIAGIVRPVPDAMELWGLLNLPFNPTAENMAEYLANQIVGFKSSISWAEIKVWETPKACAIAEVTREQ